MATNYDFHQIKTTLHDVEREKPDTLLKQNRNNNEPIGNVAKAKKRNLYPYGNKGENHSQEKLN